MGITKQVASIPSYRPASSAGLTSCAKRITPTLTPYLTPILIQNSKCHEKQEHLGTDPEGHRSSHYGSPDRNYNYKLYGHGASLAADVTVTRLQRLHTKKKGLSFGGLFI